MNKIQPPSFVIMALRAKINKKQQITTTKNVTTRSKENKRLGQYPRVFLIENQSPSFVNKALRGKINENFK